MDNVNEKTMVELIKVQQSLSVPKSRKQQNYSYRSIDDILEAVKKILPDGCYITMSDDVVFNGDRHHIKATASFISPSGSVSCSGLAWEPVKIAAMSSPQITGSCSSYARKSALCGLLMIDDSKEVDSFSKGELNQHTPATEAQREMLESYRDELEKTDNKKSMYIGQQLRNPALSFSKAADILDRLKG